MMAAKKTECHPTRLFHVVLSLLGPALGRDGMNGLPACCEEFAKNFAEKKMNLVGLGLLFRIA